MIQAARKGATVFVGWSFDWPTIEELHAFADQNGLKNNEVKVQMNIIGGKVRVCLRVIDA